MGHTICCCRFHHQNTRSQRIISFTISIAPRCQWQFAQRTRGYDPFAVRWVTTIHQWYYTRLKGSSTYPYINCWRTPHCACRWTRTKLCKVIKWHSVHDNIKHVFLLKDVWWFWTIEQTSFNVILRDIVANIMRFVWKTCIRCITHQILYSSCSAIINCMANAQRKELFR